jgi:C4-type Zn-finger protein
MKITKTYSWNRRDFSYDAKCESCGHESKNYSGYDDRNYYDNVMPAMKCEKCGRCSNDTDSAPDKTSLKYDENITM